jgi:hypothetical protein
VPRRAIAFGAFVAICAVASTAIVLAAARDDTRVGADAPAAGHRLQIGGGRGKVLVRSLDRSRPGRYGLVALEDPGSASAPSFGRLSCARVYFAAGRGICLSPGNGLPGNKGKARIFDSSLKITGQVDVTGIPSRTRVSPDGRVGATTTFVSGHSYGEVGKFSTQTLLIDLVNGRRIASLEDFVLTRDGEVVNAPDVNYWGVTFARDSNRFYATVQTGGKTYLIEGNLRTRKARTIHENVECPSLSPDGTRIAFKKLVGEGPSVWRFHVLNLKTMEETALAEHRPIDDQIEWLDNDHVLYGVDESIWTVPADGTGRPRQYLSAANSPAVIGRAAADPPAN